MAIEVEIKSFDELTRRELYKAMALRNRVFVVEQEITEEPDVDGRDPQCDHALMWCDGELVATARIAVEDEPLKIERVAVGKSHRGRGLGSQLMEAIAGFCGDRPAKLHAQSHLEGWYRRLGWRPVGEPFEEAGIEHVAMVYRADFEH